MKKVQEFPQLTWMGTESRLRETFDAVFQLGQAGLLLSRWSKTARFGSSGRA
jgi:hypothetical protein